MSETDRTEAPAEEALEEFRRKVREEAIRVAADNGWCDDGLNRTLRNLGLAEKRLYRVPVEVTLTQVGYIEVTDAMSMEEARASLASKSSEELHNLRRRNLTVAEVTGAKPWSRDGRPYEAGQMDDTVSGTGGLREDWCNAQQAGYYCTREQGHVDRGDLRHAAGNTEIITRVWDEPTGSTN